MGRWIVGEYFLCVVQGFQYIVVHRLNDSAAVVVNDAPADCKCALGGGFHCLSQYKGCSLTGRSECLIDRRHDAVPIRWGVKR
jgi:hypothetical protein